jgi:hypothetical protein
MMPFDGAKINPAARVLMEAKALCTEDAWRNPSCDGRGGWVNKHHHCVQTAIEQAADASDGPLCRAAYRAFAAVVKSQPMAWNDTPNRTLAEVHDAFDKAIVIALRWPETQEP